MRHPVRSARQLVSRTFLVGVVVGVCLAMAAGIVVLAVHLSHGPAAPSSYSFSVRYVPSAGEKDDPSRDPAAPPIQAATGTAHIQYEYVSVTTSEDLAEPILLTRVALLAPFAIFFLGCLLVLVLVRRVWTGRSFSRPAAIGLAMLGLLVIGVGKFVPWLKLRAVEVAVSELGLPVSPVGTTPVATDRAWVVPQPYGLESIDWPLVVLGLVLVLVAILIERGTRQQLEVEGLV